MTFRFGKKTRKMKYSKYLFSWHGRFQISTINLRTSLFQVEGSDVGQNIQINFCNFYIWYFYVIFFILGLGHSFFLSAFNVV